MNDNQKAQMKEETPRLVELAIVLTAALAPLFLLASEVDGDEFTKAGSGIFLAATTAAIFTAYRLWKGGSTTQTQGTFRNISIAANEEPREGNHTNTRISTGQKHPDQNRSGPVQGRDNPFFDE